MQIVTNAGRVSNALTCLRSMVVCTTRVSPSVKRPRCLTSRAAPCRRGACTKTALLPVPRSWPFFHSVPGLACLHRLVMALPGVCVEMGAGGIRLVCLVLELTGLHRFVGASYGTQPRVNRGVEEAIVASR